MIVSSIITVIFFVVSLSAITHNFVSLCKENKNKVIECGVYDVWCIEHECDDVGMFDAMCMSGV